MISRNSALGLAACVIAVTALVSGASATGRSWRAPRPLTPADILPSLPGSDGDLADAINSARVICGASNGMPVYWDQDGIHALPTVLDTGEPIDSGRATQINDRGQMSVIVNIPDLEIGLRAALYQDGVLRKLPLPEGWTGAAARWVNNRGHVVGRCYRFDEVNETEIFRASLWRDGEVILLPDLGGNDSRAFTINDLGQIGGFATDPDGRTHPVLWQNGKITVLDGPGGAETANFAQAVNGFGEVVGTSGDAPFAWLAWLPGRPIEMRRPRGMPYGQANDVNLLGEAVGWVADDESSQAAYWLSVLGKPTLLGTPGGSNAEALGNNIHGDIVGYGETASGVERAWVLWAH